MNIEKDYKPLDLKNIMVTDFKEHTQNLKKVLDNIVIDFSLVGALKGEKTLLEQAFQDTKKQILD